jgi:hypothetical protein
MGIGIYAYGYVRVLVSCEWDWLVDRQHECWSSQGVTLGIDRTLRSGRNASAECIRRRSVRLL